MAPSRDALIATEEHIVFPALAAKILAALPPDDPSRALATNPSMTRYPKFDSMYRNLSAEALPARLESMDAAGIDVQVLSIAGMLNSTHVGQRDSSLGIALAREANDLLYATVQSHPTRFRALADLPLHDPGASVSELQRNVERGFVGALVNGSIGSSGAFLDSAAYDPLLSAFEALGVPLYIHPGLPPARVRDTYYGDMRPPPGLSGEDAAGAAGYSSAQFALAGWGWHVDAGTLLLRLILSGAFDRFPRLKVVTGHCGELLPSMLNRSDTMFAPESTGLRRPVSAVLRENVWVSVSGMFDLPVLRLAVAAMGSSQVTFGTDYPFIDPAGVVPFVNAMRESFKPDEVKAMLSGNAAELFGIKLEPS